jgi:hypothetical protein
MKMRIGIVAVALVVLQFSTISHAADNGLFEMPEGSKVVSASDIVSNIYSTPNDDQAADVYVRWISGAYDAQRKNFSASLAYMSPVKKLTITKDEELEAMSPLKKNLLANQFGARCIHHKDAYRFDTSKANEVTLTCVASNKPGSKDITHMLKYRFRVTYNPSNCASREEAQKYFNESANRKATKALDYRNRFCTLTVDIPPNTSPVVEVSAFSPESLNTFLERNPGLSSFVKNKNVVSSDKKTKDEGTKKKDRDFPSVYKPELDADETD